MKLLPKGSRVWLFVPHDNSGNLLHTEHDLFYSEIGSEVDWPMDSIREALDGDVDYYSIVFNENLQLINLGTGKYDVMATYFLWVSVQSFLDV